MSMWPFRSPLQVALHEAEERLGELRLRSLVKASEAIDLSLQRVDPLDSMRGPNGDIWLPLGVSPEDGYSATDRSHFSSESELTLARDYCRIMASENAYAINVIENRINYIVGYGHTVTALPTEEVAGELNRERRKRADALKQKQQAYVTPAKEEVDEPSPQEKRILELVKLKQSAIDAWIKRERWHKRQQEIRRRLDRDGEVFIRLFPPPPGEFGPVLRFVEPFLVKQPPGSKYLFGVETERDDVETVVAYHLDGERVPAAEIIHRKANVDCNVRRGRPTLWAMRNMLSDAVKVLRNIGITSAVQTSVAAIRYHTNATSTGLSAMVSGKAEFTTQNPWTGQTERHADAGRPRTIDASDNTKYDFPSAGLNVESYGNGVSMILRGCAAAVVMPEFMLSSDASNANYSSTMVSEGPSDKQYARLQQDTIDGDMVLYEAVIDSAIERMVLPADIREYVELRVEGPRIQTRERLQEVQANKIEADAGVLSRQTWCAESNRDYEREQANIDQYEAEHPEPVMDPLSKANAFAQQEAWRAYG